MNPRLKTIAAASFASIVAISAPANAQTWIENHNFRTNASDISGKFLDIATKPDIGIFKSRLRSATLKHNAGITKGIHPDNICFYAEKNKRRATTFSYTLNTKPDTPITLTITPYYSRTVECGNSIYPEDMKAKSSTKISSLWNKINQGLAAKIHDFLNAREEALNNGEKILEQSITGFFAPKQP